jgi:mRNA interferase MazF
MAKATKIVQPRRGDVFLVSLDPTVGAEIQKTRPAVVIQNDFANRRSPIVIVAAITSQFDEPIYPTENLVRAPEGGLRVDSVVLLNQIRSVDRDRLVRRLGVLSKNTMSKVDRALLLSLGLVQITAVQIERGR